jgi:hypothetical protein
MRYLTITYYKRPNGQLDEVIGVVKSLKRKDLQTASVILDFKDQKVLQSSMGGKQVPKDWDRIVGFYYQHYAHTIERMFQENGHELKIQEKATEQADEKENNPN